jgi:hypothetical protein
MQLVNLNEGKLRAVAGALKDNVIHNNTIPDEDVFKNSYKNLKDLKSWLETEKDVEINRKLLDNEKNNGYYIVSLLNDARFKDFIAPLSMSEKNFDKYFEIGVDKRVFGTPRKQSQHLEATRKIFINLLSAHLSIDGFKKMATDLEEKIRKVESLTKAKISKGDKAAIHIANDCERASRNLEIVCKHYVRSSH